LRAGQVVTVVGTPVQGQGNLLVARAKDQPLIVSPLLGQTVDARITAQKKSSQTWTLILGIPGVLFLLCGLGGALVALIGMLTAK
jgi:predicted GTPase